MSSKLVIQSVDFRDGITKAQALAYLKKHKLSPIKEANITRTGKKITSRNYIIHDKKLFKELITNQHPIKNGNISIIKGRSGMKGKGVLDIGERIAQTIAGRPVGMYPAQVRQFIELHGNGEITNVRLARDPLSNMIIAGANMITFGELKRKMDEFGIDKLRHLYTILQVDGVEYVFEKNEVIQIKSVRSIKGESLNLGAPTIPMTVEQLFNKLITDNPQITQYDAFASNCGHFVSKIVNALGLGSDQTNTFINQNIGKLVSEPYKKIARGITDIAARGDVLLHGVGRKKKNK